MRAFLLLVSVGWALVALQRTRQAPNLITGYLISQLAGTAACEAMLILAPRSSLAYTLCYSLTLLVGLYFAMHIARRVLHRQGRGFRWFTAIEGVALSGIALVLILVAIFDAYRGSLPVQFIPHLLEGFVLLVAGLILALSLPAMRGTEFRAGTALSALWVAQGIFHYCFSLGTLTNYHLWIVLNQWVPAVMFCTAFAWMGYSLTFDRPRAR